MSLFNPSRRKTRLTVADETPTSTAICLPVQRCRRSRSIFSITVWGVGRCSRCGRDERSCNPANPSRRYRPTHLRTVRGQTSAASATVSGVCPLSTCRTIRSRPRGVSRAFLCMFIWFSPWNLKLQQPQLPRSEPDEQPNESSHLAKAYPLPSRVASGQGRAARI